MPTPLRHLPHIMHADFFCSPRPMCSAKIVLSGLADRPSCEKLRPLSFPPSLPPPHPSKVEFLLSVLLVNRSSSLQVRNGRALWAHLGSVLPLPPLGIRSTSLGLFAAAPHSKTSRELHHLLSFDFLSKPTHLNTQPLPLQNRKLQGIMADLDNSSVKDVQCGVIGGGSMGGVRLPPPPSQHISPLHRPDG